MNYKPEKANFLASLALASLVKPFGINYARRPSSTTTLEKTVGNGPREVWIQ